MGSDQDLPVDDERWGAANTERPSLRHVGLDGGGKAATVQALHEGPAIKADVVGLADEVLALEARLTLE